jgi:hypothetical protein
MAPNDDDDHPVTGVNAYPNRIVKEYLIAKVPIFAKLAKLRDDVRPIATPSHSKLR